MEIKDLLGTLYHEGMSDEEIQKAFADLYVGRETHEKALQKQKGIIDSYSSQLADAKKKERERMTKEEAETLAKQEQADRIADLEKQLKLRDVKAQYLARGFSDADATTVASALIDGDTETVLKSEKEFAEKREAALKTEWEKQYRVNPPAGLTGGKADFSQEMQTAASAQDMPSLAALIRQQYEANKPH